MSWLDGGVYGLCMGAGVELGVNWKMVGGLD